VRQEVGEIMMCEYIDPEFCVCKLKKCEVTPYICEYQCDLQTSDGNTTGNEKDQ
jgi:hypothetical protein